MYRLCALFLSLLFTLALIGQAPVLPVRTVHAAAWSEPLPLSDPGASIVAARPDLAVDSLGGVHVIWYSVLDRPADQGGGLVDAMLYRARTAGVWSSIEPIYRQDRPLYSDTSSPLSSDAAARNAAFAQHGSLASAPDGKLHLAVGGQQSQSYFSAPWDTVVRTATLLPPFILGQGTSSAVAAGGDGTVHTVLTAIPRGFEEVIPDGGTACDACIEIVYRRSAGGIVWTRPENLSRFEGQDANPQLAVDPEGRVHLLWEHLGSEGSAEPPFLVYRRSVDGGQSWEGPLPLGAPGEGSLQPALGVGAGGRLVAVYGGTTTGSVFFQASLDGGVSWSAPGLVPGVISPGVSASGDGRFSLAADGAGRLHLLVAGALPAERDGGQQLFHVIWDGQSWSPPELVASGGGVLANPRLVIERGNRLHAVWTSSEAGAADGVERQTVWYSDEPIEAPELAPLPTFTPVVTPVPTVAPTSTPLPTPTLLPAESRQQATVEGPPRWEGEALQVLVVALGPVLLLVGVVVWWATRRGRDDD